MAEYKNKPKEELIKLLEERDKAEETRKELESMDPQIIERDKQRLEIIIAQNKALGEYNSAKQAELELLDLFKKKIMDLSAARDSELKLLKSLREKEADLSKEEQKSLKILEEKVGAKLDLIKALEAERDALEQATEGTQKYTKAQEETFDKGKASWEGLATRIGLNSTAMNGLVESVVDFGKRAAKDPEVMKAAFRDVFSFQKMAMSVTSKIVEKTIQFSMAIDKASAAFAANTGAGRVMTEQIGAVGGGFRNLGIDAENAGKAAQQLFDGFSGFMQLSKDGQETLMQTVAGLEKIGVSGEIAVKNLFLLQENFGMSTKEASRMTKQLAIAGTKIGISSSKMMQGFAEASKSLAVYGKESIKVFTDLAAQAKAAGVEAATLLGIAEKYDTFEGAADSVGKLNSILGTNMSATDMLTMKENERIETLIGSIQAQGIAFKDLDKYSQKAIASAAGISDMAEAQRIFGMSIRDYRKGLQASASEEEFNKRLKDTMDIFKKLEMAAKNFAIQMGPFVDSIAGAAQMFLDFSQNFQGIPALILGGIVVLTLFGVVMAQLVPLLSIFGVISAPSATGFFALGKGIQASSKSMIKGLPALFGFAAAMVLMFGAFSLMSNGVSGEMGGSQMFGFLSGLAGGLIILGAAVGILSLFAPAIAGGSAALVVLSLALIGLGAALGIALAMLDGDKLRSIGDMFRGLGDFMVSFKVEAFTNTKEFLDTLSGLDTSIKPVLGDLALIATGQTAQNVTTNATNYSFQQFSANFKNIFKPEITVKIGEKELNAMIDERIDQKSKES